MSNPQELSIKDFTYDLPAERIAQFPLDARDQSKLLVWKMVK
jgi:S-adenosylmethionine:tRNA ribosyltransferase-isomerase